MNVERLERIILEGWPKSDITFTPEQAHLAATRIVEWFAEEAIG